VTPSFGSVIQSPNPPLVQINFSENVTGADNAANYRILGANGSVIPVNSVIYTNTGGVFRATLSFNPNQPLATDSSTLFVLVDPTFPAGPDHLPLAQPGQLVVANSGSSNVSVVGMNGSGLLQGLSNYPLLPAGTSPAVQASPTSVVLADVTGDGLP